MPCTAEKRPWRSVPVRPLRSVCSLKSTSVAAVAIDSSGVADLTASPLSSTANAHLKMSMKSNFNLTLPMGAEILSESSSESRGGCPDSPASRQSITRARLLLVCAEPAINSMLTRSARTRLCRPFQAPIHRGRFFMLNVCRYARAQHITHVPVEARPARSPAARRLNRLCANSKQSLPPPALEVKFCLGYAAVHGTDTLWWPAKAKDATRHARRGFGDSAIGPILPQEDDY
jgi:hypothetical protein